MSEKKLFGFNVIENDEMSPNEIIVINHPLIREIEVRTVGLEAYIWIKIHPGKIMKFHFSGISTETD